MLGVLVVCLSSCIFGSASRWAPQSHLFQLEVTAMRSSAEAEASLFDGRWAWWCLRQLPTYLKPFETETLEPLPWWIKWISNAPRWVEVKRIEGNQVLNQNVQSKAHPSLKLFWTLSTFQKLCFALVSPSFWNPEVPDRIIRRSAANVLSGPYMWNKSLAPHV